MFVCHKVRHEMNDNYFELPVCVYNPPPFRTLPFFTRTHETSAVLLVILPCFESIKPGESKRSQITKQKKKLKKKKELTIPRAHES